MVPVFFVLMSTLPSILLCEFLVTTIVSYKGMFGRVYRYLGYFWWACQTYRIVGYRY